jgi:prepilin-type N-terminal cleavage/methylation domain-containing protein
MTTKLAISRSSQRGVTLIELMIAMTISLLMLAGLVTLFVNTSRTNSEMAKTNYLIEDGRVTMQVLTDDLAHAGFWGGYMPQFDDLTHDGTPTDAPTAIPNPCQAYNTWDAAYEINLLGIVAEASDTLPAGAGCLSPLAKVANSDALIVRHAETCIPGTGNCDADTAGKLYFQFPLCEQEKNQTAQGGTFNSLTLDPLALAVNGAYVGATIHTTGGTGGGQYRKVTGYDAMRVATVNANWSATPDATTTYALQYVLGTTAYQLHRRDCVTLAEKRRLISNIYYVTNIAQNGITVPTLVRSQLDFAGGTLAHQAPVPLVDGIEAFRVVVGIDERSKSGGVVDYTSAIVWADPNTKTTATNRGDGAPDRFKRCTAAAPCTLAELTNIVAVKLFVLTRSRETTPGHTDNKTYCVSEPQQDGTCAVADTLGPFNDNFKRHLFTTSVRLANVSGRRDTP